MLMTTTFQMDGREITIEDGKTILEAARENGSDIPTICFHDATTANGLCRMCVVEVEGQRVLQPACIVQAGAGMKVQTRSEKVNRARKTILEMLASTMDLSEAADIQVMMNEYGVDVNRFRMRNAVKSRSEMIIRCMCAITRNVSCAGAVCRSARTMHNTRTPSISKAAAMKPRSVHSSIKPFPKRLACYAVNVWGSVPPAH